MLGHPGGHDLVELLDILNSLRVAGESGVVDQLWTAYHFEQPHRYRLCRCGDRNPLVVARQIGVAGRRASSISVSLGHDPKLVEFHKVRAQEGKQRLQQADIECLTAAATAGIAVV